MQLGAGSLDRSSHSRIIIPCFDSSISIGTFSITLRNVYPHESLQTLRSLGSRYNVQGGYYAGGRLHCYTLIPNSYVTLSSNYSIRRLPGVLARYRLAYHFTRLTYIRPGIIWFIDFKHRRKDLWVVSTSSILR